MKGLLTGALAKVVANAIGEVFLDATLTRDQEMLTTEPWGAGLTAQQSWTCKAIHEEWGASYRAAGLISAGDRKVLVLAATLCTTPAPGDRITIRSETFTVVSDKSGQPAVSSDPALAVWVLRARK